MKLLKGRYDEKVAEGAKVTEVAEGVVRRTDYIAPRIRYLSPSQGAQVGGFAAEFLPP